MKMCYVMIMCDIEVKVQKCQGPYGVKHNNIFYHNQPKSNRNHKGLRHWPSFIVFHLCQEHVKSLSQKQDEAPNTPEIILSIYLLLS